MTGTRDADGDFDGAPDAWEIQYGFNPADITDGADDTDADGRTNAQECLDLTHPRGLFTRYLAEGPVDKPTKKASSWVADASNLRRHVLPLLGPRLAMALTAADVAKFQAGVAAGSIAAGVIETRLLAMRTP